MERCTIVIRVQRYYLIDYCNPMSWFIILLRNEFVTVRQNIELIIRTKCGNTKLVVCCYGTHCA